MKIVSHFKISSSFKLSGHGLVVLGDIIDGKIKAGNYISFNTGSQNITLQIKSIEFADNISERTYQIGFIFHFKNEEEKIEFENLKLTEQVAEIVED